MKERKTKISPFKDISGFKEKRPGRVVALARPPTLPEPGTVVQIAPPHKWGGCFATITEVKEWGVIAFVAIPFNDGTKPRVAPTRLTWDEFEPLFIAAPYQLSQGET